MRLLFFLGALMILVSSCTINKNLMFKTDQDFVFDTPPDSVQIEYKISANDKLYFSIFKKKGSTLINSSGENRSSLMNLNQITYEVQQDGRVELPEVGWVSLAGMTVTEAREFLEKKYTTYKDSYIRLEVMNRRVIVFPGNGGVATAITLVNSNTTVIEALALAGGLTQRGDASQIKLIRNIPGKADPDVYLMDLSVIEGIKQANMTVQAEDIIYVEPVPEIASEILRDLTPIVTLLTSILLVITVANRNL